MKGRWSTPLLLLGAVAFVLIGLVAAAIMGAAINLAPTALRRWPGLNLPSPSALATLMAVAYGFQGTLLAAAIWRGRRLGTGGLGLRPIQSWGLVGRLCGAMLIWLVILVALTTWFPALRDLARSKTMDVLTSFLDAGPVVLTAAALLIAALAPLSEELFFRGWLWEALARRGHGMISIGLLTTLPWLLLHGLDSPGRVVFLVPAAAALFAARRLDGGVRASLAVHVVNNSAAVLLEAVAWLMH